VAPVLATFKIKQNTGVDELKDANLGQPVMLTANNEVGRSVPADSFLAN